MHAKNRGLGLLFAALILSWPGAALGAEDLLPFDDPSTHLWGYKNGCGTVVIQPRFTVAQGFSAQGIAEVADESGWMIIDKKGKVLIKPYLFDNGPDPFQEGLARFQEGGRFGFFDKHGRVTIPARYDFAAPFSEGRAAFCEGCSEHREGEHSSYRGGKWGFIDRKGRVVIAPKFHDARSFERGRASVLLDGQWTATSKTGDPIR
jgi:hypothetical protein